MGKVYPLECSCWSKIISARIKIIDFYSRAELQPIAHYGKNKSRIVIQGNKSRIVIQGKISNGLLSESVFSGGKNKLWIVWGMELAGKISCWLFLWDKKINC